MFDSEKINALAETYTSDMAKEILDLGEKIKKLDRDNDKKILIIKILSLVSLGVVGYVAFGAVGGIIFALIALISSFFLQFSSKKNVMLKYFTFYRTRIPRIIAESQGDTVEMTEPDKESQNFISSLFPQYKLKFRMCHKYGELYLGFAKFMKGDEPQVQGALYYLDRGNPDIDISPIKELLDYGVKNGIFTEYTFKSDSEHSLLFLVGADTYLNGRLDMKDDLSLDELTHQLKYYLLGKEFEKLV